MIFTNRDFDHKIIFSDSGVDLDSNDVYKAALTAKVEAVKSKMPDNVQIANPKLVKVSTNERRRRRDDHSDAYQLIFDLFQEIVKAIAEDENFATDDVAAEIADLRTAAVNAGATLPATTTVTTQSIVTATTEAVTTTAVTSSTATTPASTTPATTTPAATTSKATTPAATTPKATTPAVTTSTTTPAASPVTTSAVTISAETTKSTEKSTPSQSPQISSGSFLTLAVSLLIGNLVSRFIL